MAVVADSYGAAQEAGGTTEVAGAGVRDVVVPTDGLLRRHGYRARHRAAHDAVGAVGLVRHAGVSPRTHDVGARLCARHDSQSYSHKDKAWEVSQSVTPSGAYSCTRPGT